MEVDRSKILKNTPCQYIFQVLDRKKLKSKQWISKIIENLGYLDYTNGSREESDNNWESKDKRLKFKNLKFKIQSFFLK